MKQTLTAAVGCKIGKVRTNNEDNFYFDDKTLKEVNTGLKRTKCCRFNSEDALFAIFDGMGGEACGETASYLAASTVKPCVKQGKKEKLEPQQLLQVMCLTMNEIICKKMRQIRGRMGSTAVMLLFRGQTAYVFNLGDSRAFLLRDGKLEQISEDHTDEKTNLSLGIKRKPRLTQHLGVFPEELQLEPYVEKYELQAGDRYLLCSDGLTDMLTEEEICTIMTQSADPTQCVDKLMDTAMDRGGKDNTTIMICEV